MKIKIKFLIIGLICTVSNLFSQTDSVKSLHNKYISIQTGFNASSFNSLGIRTFLKYQNDLKGNWQFGVSYENTRHFGSVVTDYEGEKPTNFFKINV